MASITSLAIRGVRSFDAHEKEQVIEFDSGLTVIVGNNGSGKTTIFECLMYGITGGLPPGLRLGEEFVSDPTFFQRPGISACVKLQLKSRTNEELAIVRNMKVRCLKNDILLFENTDQQLRRRDPKKKKMYRGYDQEIDLNQYPSYVSDQLGVSKVILEHILLCPQESASWPLERDAPKKFKDVFYSDKRIPKIEEARKMATEMQLRANVCKAKEAVLKARQVKARELNQLLRQFHDLEAALDDKKKAHGTVIEQTHADVQAKKSEFERAEGHHTSKFDSPEFQSSLALLQTASDNHQAAIALEEEAATTQAKLHGRWRQVVESIHSIKRKLSVPEYENIDEKCQEAEEIHATTQIEAENLRKIYDKLDKDWVEFHEDMITGINDTIRKIWDLTCDGADITKIELVSTAEGSSGMAHTSYNYHVAMTKGYDPIVMRGRCSAGQQVLAGIVIRLAFAETFPITCSCFALDEPTAKLDSLNKERLAVHLAKIMEWRAQQPGFQFILATHDTDFVAMLKNELARNCKRFSMPKKYFQVSLQQELVGRNFYSKIDSKHWKDLKAQSHN